MKQTYIREGFFKDADLHNAVKMRVFEIRSNGLPKMDQLKSAAQSAADKYVDQKVKEYRKKLHEEIRHTAFILQNAKFEQINHYVT